MTNTTAHLWCSLQAESLNSRVLTSYGLKMYPSSRACDDGTRDGPSYGVRLCLSSNAGDRAESESMRFDLGCFCVVRSLQLPCLLSKESCPRSRSRRTWPRQSPQAQCSPMPPPSIAPTVHECLACPRTGTFKGSARGLVGLATTAELHAHFELETHLICGPAFTKLYDKLLDDDMRREIADTCLYKAKPLDRIRMIEKDALINAAINAAYCSSLLCYANSCKTFHAKTVVEQAAAFFGPHVLSGELMQVRSGETYFIKAKKYRAP